MFLGALLLSIFFGKQISKETASVLYAISITIKNCLIFCLPFIIFALISKAFAHLGARSLKYILIILALVCTSNMMNTMLSYVVTSHFLDMKLALASSTNSNSLLPAFELKLPKLISNDTALCLGTIVGIFLGIKQPSYKQKAQELLDKIVKIFFKVLLPLMPIFIFGTLIKLQRDGILTEIIKNYLPVTLIFIISAYGVVILELMILARFNLKKIVYYVQNMIPAIITALGAMSSAAALPLSLEAAKKNIENEGNADLIVPATVNIHLVGDCFFIPMIALTVMLTYGMNMPSLSKYVIFALHFILAKFAVAAVPGGGVLVMIPIMQTYLGLNSEMLALVTAIYILFDPIITMCNVAGNGALAILFDKITKK